MEFFQQDSGREMQGLQIICKLFWYILFTLHKRCCYEMSDIENEMRTMYKYSPELFK